jgi:hypothetical protein
MDDIKRKVYLDLFASPGTLLPIVGGLTALLAAWALPGSQEWLSLGGVAGLLGGIGLFASRLVFGLEKMTDRAYEYVVEKKQRRQVESLTNLHAKLESDQDPRTHRLLEELWTLYRTLEKDIKDGKIAVAAHEVLDGVDRLFHVCTGYLDQSFELLVQAGQMRGGAKDLLLQQREELILEVGQSVKFLEDKVTQLRITATQKDKSELSSLRAELDETIRVAKRAEERTSQLGNEPKPYDAREFE